MERVKIYVIENYNAKVGIKDLNKKIEMLDYERTFDLESCDVVLFAKNFYKSKGLLLELNLAANVFKKRLISEEDFFIKLIMNDKIKDVSE